ncbi:hypothetical protein C7N43_38585 [Sphingobacteriales bacterium UPWRP_1]|nr:hypothetical protein B6N25_14315 [Sphingobacteriales bacterium TSM_CSS]PSJ71584.1 hypothetical protein C7N43_38585 [Sphingobacteriales bacterium UPWRP_1]
MAAYKIKWGAAVKPNETQREDAHRLPASFEHGTMVTGIADGAGGMGVFVGKWAQTLLEGLPDLPFENGEAIKSWFMPLSVNFFKTHKIEAQQHEHTWNKFLLEGSAATLTALWLPEDMNETSACFCLMYGDSPMMRYQLGKQRLIMPPHLPALSSFSHKTQLLNWNGAYPFQLNHCHCHVFKPENEQILLATDALAQLILIRYLLESPDDENSAAQLRAAETAGGIQAQLIAAHRRANLPRTFIEWLSLLLNSLNVAGQPETDDFKNLLHQYCEQGLVEEDDYTLIAIETPCFPPTPIPE